MPQNLLRHQTKSTQSPPGKSTKEEEKKKEEKEKEKNDKHTKVKKMKKTLRQRETEREGRSWRRRMSTTGKKRSKVTLGTCRGKKEGKGKETKE